jgi:hypothetical protein
MSLADIEQYTLLGNQLVNFHNLSFLAVKLFTDLFFTFIIIRLIFYPIYKEREYVFAGMMINIAVFMISFLMGSIKLKIGFAFGLFAVFSMIRYRTEPIPIRQMTYLFIIIILAVLNALSDKIISYAELLFSNIFIVTTIFLIEHNFLYKTEHIKVITYEKIDLIKPENYGQLLLDLKQRTGFDIRKAEIETINFLNDTAKIKIIYRYPEEFEAKNKKKETV